MKKRICTLIVIFFVVKSIQAQSTMLLKVEGSILGYYPAAAGVGVGVGVGAEFNLGKKSTLGISISGGKIQDIVNLKYGISPEFRYYFNTAFKGFYLAGNGNYDKIKQINDNDNDFGSYLFGVGAKAGYNIWLKNKIVTGLSFGTTVIGPSRSDNSVKSKFTANLEIGYRF